MSNVSQAVRVYLGDGTVRPLAQWQSDDITGLEWCLVDNHLKWREHHAVVDLSTMVVGYEVRLNGSLFADNNGLASAAAMARKVNDVFSSICKRLSAKYPDASAFELQAAQTDWDSFVWRVFVYCVGSGLQDFSNGGFSRDTSAQYIAGYFEERFK